MTGSETRSFSTLSDLETWLMTHHATRDELWVRIFKKASGTPSVTWQDCVEACLVWGWIDGVRRSLDEDSFVQCLTPRRAKSTWSKRNCEHAERLIAAGKMQPAGLAHVEAARSDGRWDRAYAGSANMELPEDFVRRLDTIPASKARFATLKRQDVYSIYHRLHTAKRPETRAKRMEAILASLTEVASE
jgi:uncharacterized protein YdeI (YjbR/CyaY-like superfamily)